MLGINPIRRPSCHGIVRRALGLGLSVWRARAIALGFRASGLGHQQCPTVKTATKTLLEKAFERFCALEQALNLKSSKW